MSIIPNPSCDRSNPVYAAYQPDSAVVTAIRPLLCGKTIKMVIGTWCCDSQTQVPAFYKILDEARFSEAGVHVIEVNKEKEAADGSIDYLHIESVPTFVMFDNEHEMGRIIEQPDVTLENDLLQILLKK